MHRSAREGEEARKTKKLLGKSIWFKKKKRREGRKRSKKQRQETPEIVTVLFVPQTPKGELAKKLQFVENKISKLSGERVKIVERGGTQVKQILHKSNPWSKGFCGRSNCLPCLHGDGTQNCFDKNVVYQIKCIDCTEEEKKTAVYVGQTSRSMYERGQEHLMGLKKSQESSPLYKHVCEEHKGETTVKFEMKIVKKHFSAFSRLVHEALVIERTSKANDFLIMNSKGEWGRSHLPRLSIDEPLDVSKENLVRENNFSNTEKEWNVLKSKKTNVQAKRKVSSIQDTDSDDKPKSSNNKNLATFTFSQNNIENSTKAEDNLNPSNGKVHSSKTQSAIFRFLAAKPNFKVRKKLKLTQ